MQAETDIAEPIKQKTGSTAQGYAQGDLETSIMNVIGRVTATIVSGFAAYRWYTGDYTGAIINIAIVLAVVGALLMGRTQRFQGIARNLFGVTISAACLVSALAVSENGLLWALLVLLINALTLPRAWAWTLNLTIIIVLASAMNLYLSPLHQVSWTSVALLTTGFSLMSMDQLRVQRQLLVQQANLDPLTGAGNRRLMVAHLQELASDRRRGRRPAAIMVLDLDRFKMINDRYGHETGDKVLVDFAQSLGAAMRADDGLYRMGGEEFVLLLRGLDEATARDYLPELHQRLSGAVSVPDGTLKFSAGAAVLRDGENWSAWLARADRALYHAKADGRDRLEFTTT